MASNSQDHTLDTSDSFSGHMTPIWAALSSIVSGIGAWLLSRRTIDATIERARIQSIAEQSAVETEERMAFREMLMTEVSIMRQVMKDCEADKERLRERLNTALAQSLVLRATVEIMEKRVAFGRNRQTPSDRSDLVEAPGDDPANPSIPIPHPDDQSG